MLKTIIRKELLENIFSFRFPLFTVLCVLLIPLAMYVSQINLGKKTRDYHEQTRLADEAAAAITMNDVMAGRVAIKAFRPPARLSVFAQGFESALPRYYEFSQDGFSQGQSASGDESLQSAQGKIDFVFLLQMILSLIGLLFASDMVAGEKEAGTLRAMLSNSLPRDSILFGKILGGFLALWAPFAVAFLIGVIVLLSIGFPAFAGDTPARISTLFLSASLFLFIYYTIGGMISISTGRTRTALVMILLIWVSFQLIVPKLGDMIADIVYPIRTETEVSLSKSLLAKSLDDETSRELGRQYTLIFPKGEPSGQGDDPTPEQKKWAGLKDEIEKSAREAKARQLARIDETYRQEKRIRNAISTDLALFSPSTAFGRLAADICGTGEIGRTKYMEAVQSHQKALDEALFSRVRRTVMALPGGRTSLSFSMQPIDLQTLPKFSITPVSLTAALKANAGSLLSLAFWLIAPFAFAYLKFLRYDVR